jgi:hypothetical protein
MMKKIFSLMILAMFIISMVPLTLAEEGNGNGNSGATEITTAQTTAELVTATAAETSTDGGEATTTEITTAETTAELVTVTAAETTAEATEAKSWREIENDIRRFVFNSEHDDASTCVGNVQNKFFEHDADRVENAARYFCSIWAKKQGNNDKPMLPAYEVKQARIGKNKPELVKVLPKFDEAQKRLIGKEFSRARYEWCLKNENDCKTVIKNLANSLKKAEMVKEISKEKALEARKRFAKAKDMYDEKLVEAKEKRANFLELRERKEVSEDDRVEAASEYLVEKIELVMRHLDKLKERVLSAEGMEEEKANAIVKRIDTEMDKLTVLIEKAKAAETKEDIRAVADALKNIWKGFQPETKGYAVGLMHAKVNDIIVRSNSLEKKLDSMIESAELRDIDVSIVDEKVDKFSQKIEMARQAYADSKDMLAEATEFRKDNSDATEEVVKRYKDMVKEANDKLKEARELIKEANDVLKEIIKELKNAYKGVLPEVDELEEEAKVALASCVDNDFGRDIFTASFVSGDSGKVVGEFNDFCSNNDAGIGHVDEGTYVHEYFCEDGFVVGITKECSNGCSVGACIA